MKHFIHLDNGPYEMIKKGQKIIEMRLYDEKRQKIKKDDLIEFENRDTLEKLSARVINLHLFKSFDELYKAFDKKVLGYGEDEDADPNDMGKYYDSKDIEKYGVVGIEIELVK